MKLNFKKILSHLKSVPSNLKKRETSRYKQLTSSFGPKMFYCGIFEMKLENYCHISNQENASVWYLWEWIWKTILWYWKLAAQNSKKSKIPSKKKGLQIWNHKWLIWIFLGWYLKKLLPHLKSTPSNLTKC